MSDEIDPDFRPRTYFRPEKLEKYLLSKVKGTVLREKLKALFEASRHDQVKDLVGDAAFSVADRKALESIHPMFMGGNYLADTEDGEVEIARISIRSTTLDVTSVYARPVDGAIRYSGLDRLYRQRVREHFPNSGTGDECPFCGHFNSPPADDLCEHAVAWVWDGKIETLADGRAFESAMQRVVELDRARCA